MVWNITQDTAYATALEEQYQKRMSNLRYRSQELDTLCVSVESQIFPRFEKMAAIWADKRKSLDKVEYFLFGMLQSKKLEAHHLCMGAWGAAIHAKPSSLYDLLYIKNMPRLRPEGHCSNPLFKSSDSFATLNAYLAIDPMGCLQQPGLLSGTWLDGLTNAEQSDAAIMAIMSAFYRYGDQMDRAAQVESKGRMAHAKDMLVLIGDSAGRTFKELVDLLPANKKASPVLAKYYRNLVDAKDGTPGASFPYIISRQHKLVSPDELFDLAMKVRLFSTTAHENYLVSGGFMMWDEENAYYHHCISNPYATADQLSMIINPSSVSKDHIQAMHEKGLATTYLKNLEQEDRYMLIEKGLVPITMLSRAKDKGHFLENALGL
jgi:hypothetical protein